MIKVSCPSCNASYDVDEHRLPEDGLRMRCPKCSESF
ncbi:MAG: zinc-ribbon domain-containing protein, partial [Deltaproteobacteria bacterium]|nr:zinc-ribbon domain-containing protein [Deltaproteobacteria bacterium]